MGVGCYEECKKFISNEKKTEFTDDAITDVPIKHEKKVSFSQNPKTFKKQKTFTESLFGLFEKSEKKKKSNLKSPSTKNVIKHMKNNLIENKISNGKELRKKKRSVQLNNITNNIEINHFDIRPHYIFQNNDIKGNKNKKLNEINLEIKQFQIKENDEDEIIKSYVDENKKTIEHEEEEKLDNTGNNLEIDNNKKENNINKSEDEIKKLNQNNEPEISKSNNSEKQQQNNNNLEIKDNNLENNNTDNNNEQKNSNNEKKGEDEEGDDNNFEIIDNCNNKDNNNFVIDDDIQKKENDSEYEIID